MFKYKIDRIPVALIAGLSVVDFAAYCLLDSVWLLTAYWVASIVPKGMISCFNHHHQHVATFRSTALNRLYEVSLALHTGITTNLWCLHHVLGHHVTFLDQSKDESRWKRKSGRQMGVVEYTLEVALTAYYRGYIVGKRYPRHQRVFLVWTALAFALVGALLWFRPMAGLFIYVLPMVSCLLYTSWVTYGHHAGLDTQDSFAASYNTLNYWFNLLTGNLGYHTAHHHRQAVHWSLLPELHCKIESKIPADLYKKSAFDFAFPHVKPRSERISPDTGNEVSPAE